MAASHSDDGAVRVSVRAEHRDQVVEAELGDHYAGPPDADQLHALMRHWRGVLDELAGDLRLIAHVLMNRGAAALAVDVLTGDDDPRPARVLQRHLACWRAGDTIRDQLGDRRADHEERGI
jgi:hypothetical protein